ncbi:MAG: helix-turn-helix domain-containing protein [Dehalococcoidia bacterium]
MQATEFESLRDMVMHYARRRGWRTQRHVAVACGFDESGLSRFLNGEQDIGARRTHTLFQAVGVPVEQYDVAYSLLGQVQEQARANREAWLARRRDSLVAVSDRPTMNRGPQAIRGSSTVTAVRPLPVTLMPPETPGGIRFSDGQIDDLPAAVLIARFRQEQWTGEQIAVFFDGLCAAA